MRCRDVVEVLDDLSPQKYDCNWDNVGLLVGRKNSKVQKILVSLDASKKVVDYAVQ